MENKKWYNKPTGSGQAIIIEEQTGKTVALCYQDDEQANLIASALEMYNALQKLRSEAESLLNQQTYIHMTEADFIQLCKNFLGATSELCTDTLNKAKGDTSC